MIRESCWFESNFKLIYFVIHELVWKHRQDDQEQSGVLLFRCVDSAICWEKNAKDRRGEFDDHSLTRIKNDSQIIVDSRINLELNHFKKRFESTFSLCFSKKIATRFESRILDSDSWQALMYVSLVIMFSCSLKTFCPANMVNINLIKEMGIRQISVWQMSMPKMGFLHLSHLAFVCPASSRSGKWMSDKWLYDKLIDRHLGHWQQSCQPLLCANAGPANVSLARLVQQAHLLNVLMPHRQMPDAHLIHGQLPDWIFYGTKQHENIT